MSKMTEVKLKSKPSAPHRDLYQAFHRSLADGEKLSINVLESDLSLGKDDDDSSDEYSKAIKQKENDDYNKELYLQQVLNQEILRTTRPSELSQPSTVTQISQLAINSYQNASSDSQVFVEGASALTFNASSSAGTLQIVPDATTTYARLRALVEHQIASAISKLYPSDVFNNRRDLRTPMGSHHEKAFNERSQQSTKQLFHQQPIKSYYDHKPLFDRATNMLPLDVAKKHEADIAIHTEAIRSVLEKELMLLQVQIHAEESQIDRATADILSTQIESDRLRETEGILLIKLGEIKELLAAALEIRNTQPLNFSGQSDFEDEIDGDAEEGEPKQQSVVDQSLFAGNTSRSVANVLRQHKRLDTSRSRGMTSKHNSEIRRNVSRFEDDEDLVSDESENNSEKEGEMHGDKHQNPLAVEAGNSPPPSLQLDEAELTGDHNSLINVSEAVIASPIALALREENSLVVGLTFDKRPSQSQQPPFSASSMASASVPRLPQLPRYQVNPAMVPNFNSKVQTPPSSGTSLNGGTAVTLPGDRNTEKGRKQRQRTQLSAAERTALKATKRAANATMNPLYTSYISTLQHIRNLNEIQFDSESMDRYRREEIAMAKELKRASVESTHNLRLELKKVSFQKLLAEAAIGARPVNEDADTTTGTEDRGAGFFVSNYFTLCEISSQLAVVRNALKLETVMTTDAQHTATEESTRHFKFQRGEQQRSEIISTAVQELERMKIRASFGPDEVEQLKRWLTLIDPINSNSISSVQNSTNFHVTTLGRNATYKGDKYLDKRRCDEALSNLRYEISIGKVDFLLQLLETDCELLGDTANEAWWKGSNQGNHH